MGGGFRSRLYPQSATTGRSRMTGLGQANGSQDAGYARNMTKTLY